MTATSWDDLVTVALLGTSRRSVADVALPPLLAEAAARLDEDSGAGPDPAARLLDLAALATVYRRAGVSGGAPARIPPAAAPDPRPGVGAAAADRLTSLIAGGDRELLALWLGTASDRGLRPPFPVLPALLDLACRHPQLAPVVLSAAGPRGVWLARHRPHWAALLAADAAVDPAAQPDRDWTTGTRPERLAWLSARRRADPAAARDALEASWPKEAPEDRAALLRVLAQRPGPADERFLERCLADRRGDVRAVAAQILTSLPTSALARRATEGALAAVRLERSPLGRRLAVTMPAGHDAGMAHDQLPAPPAQVTRGGGPGAWLLLHVVAAAPLATWVPRLADSPAEVAALDVADGRRSLLWFGWARAAAREGDAGWAAALLERAPDAVGGEANERPGPTDVAGAVAVLLRLVPAPWPLPLAAAMIGWLDRRPRLDDPDGRAVLDLAARRLPTEAAGALRDVARRWPPLSASRRVAAAAVDLMTVRREMLEELQ